MESKEKEVANIIEESESKWIMNKYIIIFLKNIDVGKEKIKIILKPANTTDEMVVSPGKDYLAITTKGSLRFYEILEKLKKNFEPFRKKTFYFYANQTFVIYPNAFLRDIYDNFGNKESQDKTLSLHYSSIEAWG